MTRILLIEDAPGVRDTYHPVLREAGHDVTCARTASEAMEHVRNWSPTVVLLELDLPDSDGMDLIGEIQAFCPGARTIVVTASSSVSRAVEAMRKGAFDVLVRPFDDHHLLPVVENAVLELSSGTPQGVVTFATGPTRYLGFIGSSPEMREVYDIIRCAARSVAPVFITGQSGTGKDVCANAVHRASQRAAGPFVTLDCGSVPPEELEAELFGQRHVVAEAPDAAGSGLVAAADRGTLFLDEVCDLDLSIQSRLLRFLQTSTVHPAGASRPAKVNVRLVCATSRNPLEEVRRGTFREDLYYRLHVVPIHMPPLRDRGRDVIEIAETILHRVSREEGKTFSGLSEAVKEAFVHHPWPGNVRQLTNTIRNIVVLHDGPQITQTMLPPDLFFEIAQTPCACDTCALAPTCTRPSRSAFSGRTLSEIERAAIEAALCRNAGSIQQAARELNVAPSTIYRKRQGWRNEDG